MKKLFWALFCLIFIAGCSNGTFHIPKQEYKSKVQVLGVLPLLVDRNSMMNYPDKEWLFDRLESSSRGKHQVLVDALVQKKGYFDVRPLDVDTHLTTLSLLAHGSSHDKDGRPTGYAFDVTTVAEIARRNVVDALLVVVFSGETLNETRRSRTKLETLTTSYSNLVATAAVVDRNAQVLWQLSGDDSYTAMILQYPDFDEAYYNHTDVVKVKNVSIQGVERMLAEDPDAKGVNTLPSMYSELFDKIVSGISPGVLDSLR